MDFSGPSNVVNLHKYVIVFATSEKFQDVNLIRFMVHVCAVLDYFDHNFLVFSNIYFWKVFEAFYSQLRLALRGSYFFCTKEGKGPVGWDMPVPRPAVP